MTTLVHGSVPEKGVNAVENMAKVVCSLHRLKESYKRHELLGTPTIYTCLIEGGSECAIVPDFCRILIEKRTIPGETGSDAINEVNKFLTELSEENPQFKADVKKLFERQSMEISPNEAIF